jgi:hypothetical protein
LIRNRVSYRAGRWEISMASYPCDEKLIESLPFLNAAA